jgi:adenylate cyclase
MRQKTKIATNECLIIILSWIAIYYFYYIIAFWGISPYLKEGILIQYLFEWYVHIELLTGSILFGILFCFIDFFTDRTSIRRKSFGALIIIKSILYFVMVIFVFGLIYGLFYLFEVGPFETPDLMMEIVNFHLIISWFLFFIFSILLMTFMVQVNRKFGPGNMRKMIMGKYYKPLDEFRIFLFLDLKNSTSIAETLGHNMYSKFIQNCYHDLTDVIIKYKADIYQYVGDEVVLTWIDRGDLNSLSGIKLYFDFKETLTKKDEFYLNNFGVVPEFKGGMDYGVVTVTEVGDLKRELAYHGDVLNTAARIQSMCKEFGADLLISENLKIHIKNFQDFNTELIGEVGLRGKERKEKIYHVEQKQKTT